ncbi:MAG: 3-dehydroquinate synthase [Synergistaceae bacterium]|jgi:3-dehydroquinate synthase|nr:3-dehydroquinate synthase [Synergistaceae bacterium]
MKIERSVEVGLAERKYVILIGRGILENAGDLISPLCISRSPVAVVTDTNVWRLWGERLASSLSEAGVAFEPIVSPAGEENKTLGGLSCLYDGFAWMGLRRDGLVIAFGGGVVGDMAGFAAATWMRGIRYVQIPTTLLAQVDSSVGGKTAVNLPQGKNLAGVFYQPKLVVTDTSTLETLPEREIRCGVSEVIKYGAISSANLFNKLLDRTPVGGMAEIAGECCRIKSEIVERDELDSRRRMLLNFGHTFGHAIEKISGFGEYRHGEAVAFGMVIAAVIGERAGVTRPGTADKIRKALSAWGLDADYPQDSAPLIPLLSADKKSVEGGVRMILLRRIGDAFVKRMSFSEIEALLKPGMNGQTRLDFEGGGR